MLHRVNEAIGQRGVVVMHIRVLGGKIDVFLKGNTV
jgi:hypothetical protein